MLTAYTRQSPQRGCIRGHSYSILLIIFNSGRPIPSPTSSPSTFLGSLFSASPLLSFSLSLASTLIHPLTRSISLVHISWTHSGRWLRARWTVQLLRDRRAATPA